ncbi:MAG: hypothetical protein AB7N61_14790 [Acidimicrobiia bacterium]
MRVAVVLASVLAVCAGCSTGGGGASEPPPDSAPSATVGRSEQPGDSPGSTAPDPVRAAVAFVAATDNLMAHSSIGRAEIFRKLVVPDQVAANAQAFEQVAESMATTLEVPVIRLTWVEAPLTATLVEAAGDTATVDVWTVAVLGAPDSGPPQQVWRTVTVVLDLVEGQWLVADSSADSGPTPVTSDLALPAAFDAFAEVASWSAVVQGVGL